MVDIKFDPQDATAGVGQDVCWINEDTIDHNAVAESGADFKSELYGKGETFTTAIDSPGTVEYVCTVHPGMTGTFDRRAASAGRSRAAATSPSRPTVPGRE